MFLNDTIWNSHFLVLLNENFTCDRPLSVTGAFLLQDGCLCFHQMNLDRINDNDEYILQNSQECEVAPKEKV